MKHAKGQTDLFIMRSFYVLLTKNRVLRRILGNIGVEVAGEGAYCVKLNSTTCDEVKEDEMFGRVAFTGEMRNAPKFWN
jgi:hypothetical protein